MARFGTLPPEHVQACKFLHGYFSLLQQINVVEEFHFLLYLPF